MSTTYWYRVEETTYSAGTNEWGDPLPGGPTRTNLLAYPVVKETPCGAWIGWTGPNSEKRFINRSWSKRFACPTVAEAIVSFKARKRWQISILHARIRQAEEALRYLDTEGFYTDARLECLK